MFPSGHIPPDNSPQTMIAHTLLYGVTDKLMRQVQSVQNAAARLITEPNIANTSHRYCVNFIGCRSDDELNSRWPPGRRYSSRLRKFCSLPQVFFGETEFVFFCVRDFLGCYSCALQIFLLTYRKCSVTRVHSRFGDRCFAAAGPRIWNNLPASLRDKEVSCTEFRRQLKTFMFQMDCGTS